MEPTPEQMERASAALIPFDQAWRLSLNPEDLDELSYAVLTHFDSTASYEEIDAAVRRQIADAKERTDRLRSAFLRAHQDGEQNTDGR